MLEWVTTGPGARFGLIVHHDDAVREFAYDRDAGLARLARGLLKCLIDRVFLPGIVFAYEGNGHFAKKLFDGRTSRVLITTDTPGWYLWLGYRNGSANVLRRQILDFVGLKVTHMKTIGPIRDATPATIDKFKDGARQLVS